MHAQTVEGMVILFSMGLLRGCALRFEGEGPQLAKAIHGLRENVICRSMTFLYRHVEEH